MENLKIKIKENDANGKKMPEILFLSKKNEFY